VPILNRLPRDHKSILGDRITTGIYDLLDKLIIARHVKEKLDILEGLNSKLDILRYQTRLLVDIGLMKLERYEYVSKVIDEIGKELGGWLKHLRQRHKQQSMN